MASKTNPYAGRLEARDPIEVIEATAGELEGLCGAMGPEGAERETGPGKWKVREVLCHLADAEIAFGFRLRQALADEHHVIQPYDQDSWAAHYSAYASADDALGTFAAIRRWNLALIRHALPFAGDKRVTHPERGEMTFRTIVETMAGHDLHHLSQLEGIGSR